SLQLLLPVASRLKLFVSDALCLRIKVSPLEFQRHLLGVTVSNALAQTAFDVVVDDLGETSELCLDRLGLLNEHLEHVVLQPLGEDEIVTAYIRSGLELAVDPAISLLDAPRVPGEIEVE